MVFNTGESALFVSCKGNGDSAGCLSVADLCGRRQDSACRSDCYPKPRFVDGIELIRFNKSCNLAPDGVPAWNVQLETLSPMTEPLQMGFKGKDTAPVDSHGFKKPLAKGKGTVIGAQHGRFGGQEFAVDEDKRRCGFR